MKKILVFTGLLLALFTYSSASTPVTILKQGPMEEQQSGGTKIVTNHPDLVIKIKRCMASGNTCVIDMVVTNTGDSDLKDVLFYSGYDNFSTAFDDEGNQYGKRALLIGMGNGELAGRTSSRTDAVAQLPANVPLKMRIQVEGVPDSATEFTRINLACRCNELSLSKSKPMVLSRIPISRDGDE